MSTAAPKPLPVPPLEHTVEAVVRAVGAVVDAPTLRATEAAARAFLAGPGPALQERLRQRATREASAGRSWLSAWWLRDYLAVREPLPLSTNVAFQINPSFLDSTCGEPTDADAEDMGSGDADPGRTDGAPDVGRAARFIHRAAAVHLTQARGQTPQETDPRGNPVDMTQWECLAGGLRHPRPGVDEILAPRAGAAHREIGVFRVGRLYAVPVADDDGAPLPVSTLAESLRAVLRAAARKTEQDQEAPGSRVSVIAPGALPFAAASALGSGELAPLLAEALQDPRNAATYARLRDLLFTATLTDEVLEDAEHLRRLAFEPSRVWALRPISYEIGLRDDWLCLHAEHSTVDGATLVAAIRRMQEAAEDADGSPQPIPGTDPAETGRGVGQSAAGEKRPEETACRESAQDPAELMWDWSEAARATIRDGLARGLQEAGKLETAIIRVPRPTAEGLPLKLSVDAVSQLILTVAQQLAYGRTRAVYEAVDMREYRAGRTECLRPVTPEAVAFARALISEDATLDMFSEALEAHRSWVKACKRGEGVDRHLLGLRRIAAEGRDVDAPARAFLEDPGVAAATTDFLSTTSIGGAQQIVRYAFAPTVPEGFGISYTPHPEAIEYCLTWHRDTADAPEEFLAALPRAATLLGEFVRGLGQ
ncbi:choline/carnitine O-acyltransferase [Rothia kristinae]|uniref:choline/carnitine O-acyltransferase n=1 Tax=Rothia kristinae TaxID=37923 RepID=UPI002E2E7ECB|nr:choline/carnitine O-acyltransferase [Rothia kristinae]MED6046872.1 choline/carnitine O-acyltransferase [Rothia kristinae]